MKINLQILNKLHLHNENILETANGSILCAFYIHQKDVIFYLVYVCDLFIGVVKTGMKIPSGIFEKAKKNKKHFVFICHRY